MKSINLLFALHLAVASSVLAHAGKNHEHSHEHADKPKAAQEKSTAHAGHVQEMLQSLKTQMGEVEKSWKDLEHDALHTALGQVDSTISQMQSHLSDLAADKKKRVQGYLKNLSRLSHQLHQAADEKKEKLVESTAKKWKAQLQLIESQFGVKTKNTDNEKKDAATSAREEFAQGLAKAKPAEAQARTSLAKKDSVKAHEALMSLHGVLHMVNPADLSAEDKAVWEKEDKIIMDALHPLGNDKTLKSLEPVMQAVSQALQNLWKHFGVKP